MIQVFIIDDHPATIMGVQSILQQAKDIEVTGTFTSGKDLLEGLKEQQPHVLLLDIHIPDLTGNRLARIISDKYPQIALLAFTNMNNDFHMMDMIRHGCLGYIFKTADAETIIKAVREVYHGRKFVQDDFTPEVKQEMVQLNKQMLSPPPLTKRELEVLELICSGKTNQQIADLLCVSLRTAESHRFNLSQKLNATNTAEVVKMALRLGLVD